MIVRPTSYQSGLIQSVRTHQAIMEAGVTVSIYDKYLPVYKYLNKFFKLDYTLNEAPLVDVEINHKIPFVRIGNETRDLIYPKSVFDKAPAFWGKRTTKFLFIGFIPKFRQDALKRWRARASIIGTNTGRKSLERFWDPTYYKLTGRAQFVLCPNGGWPWSYRFFEAILCGATPVVQTEVPCYKGFYYHRWKDTSFKRLRVEENFKLAKERLTLSDDLLLENLIKI